MSGYQVMVLERTNASLGAHSEVTETLSCPAGKYPTGGGVVVYNATGRWVMTTSGLHSAQTWGVTLANIAGGPITAGLIKYTVVCMTA